MKKMLLSESCRYLLAAMLLFSSNQLKTYGQDGTIKNPQQFLFPGFSKCRVAMKTGKDLSLVMNYNIVTGKMVFIQRDQIYDMVEYNAVDTVYIFSKKFIPAGEVFYEVALEARVSLYIQHTGTIQSPPKPAAYGGTSEVSSSTYISNVQMTQSGNNYRMNNQTDLIVKTEPVYWIDKDGKLEKVQTKRKLIDLLSDHKPEIREYLKKERTYFNDPEDILKLMIYYNSLLV